MSEPAIIEIRIKFDTAKGGDEAKVAEWLKSVPYRNRNYVVRQLICKFFPVKDIVVEDLIDQTK